MRNFLPIVLLLILVGGCGGHPGKADLEAARSSADFPSLLSQTHDWFMIWVLDSDSKKVATLNRKEKQLSWAESPSIDAQDITDAEALTKLKASLNGKPGKLILHFSGLPRRGSFVVDVSPEGAVTKVGDFTFAD